MDASFTANVKEVLKTIILFVLQLWKNYTPHPTLLTREKTHSLFLRVGFFELSSSRIGSLWASRAPLNLDLEMEGSIRASLGHTPSHFQAQLTILNEYFKARITEMSTLVVVVLSFRRTRFGQKTGTNFLGNIP